MQPLVPHVRENSLITAKTVRQRRQPYQDRNQHTERDERVDRAAVSLIHFHPCHRLSGVCIPCLGR